MIIDGKSIADDVVRKLKMHPKKEGLFCGAVLVGDDAASVNFLKQKEKVARELGIEFRLYNLSATITTDELRAEIGRLAQPKNCGGFIVQLPLPHGVNRHYVLNAIPKEKDIDCLSEAALGAFYTERGKIAPPSVETVAEILARELPGSETGKIGGDMRALKAVVVGAGFLIGKPVGFWLQNRVGELVVLDITVKDIHAALADADIVVSGTGHAGLFGAEHLKSGAIVIDFGYGKTGEGADAGAGTGAGKKPRIVGDFDPHGADTRGIRYTKTPGGTGPVLVAKLFENFYMLNSIGN